MLPFSRVLRGLCAIYPFLSPTFADSSSTVASGSAPNNATATATGTQANNVTATATRFKEQDKLAAFPTTANPTSGCAVISVAQWTNVIQGFTATETYVMTSNGDVSTTTTTLVQTPPSPVVYPASFECVCTNGETAGAMVGQDSAGTVYIYCETGATDEYSSAVTTFAPSPTPGSAMNLDWIDVACNYGSLISIYNNVTQRWADAGTTAAWQAVSFAWTLATPAEIAGGLSAFINNFFHASPYSNCGVLGQTGNSCGTSIECGQSSSPNAVVSCPAGYILLNSMASLHTILDDLYTSLGSAQTDIIGNIGEFATTFSVVQQQIIQTDEEQAALREKFRIALIALNFITAFTFTVALKEIAVLASRTVSNSLSLTGTLIYGELSNSFSYEELSYRSLNFLYTQDAITQYASVVIESWQNSTQTLATQIFSDTATIWKFIDQGQFFTDPTNITAQVEKAQIEEAVYLNTLPMAWNGGPTTGVPVLVRGYSYWPGCSGWNGSVANYVYPFSVDSDASDTCMTIDGVNYWLVSIKTAADVDWSRPMTSWVTISKPAGWDSLNGTTFGGLSNTTVYNSIINSWIANDYSNDYSVTGNASDLASTVSQTALEDAVSQSSLDLTMIPGLVQIPVCIIDLSELNDGLGPGGIYSDPYNSKKTAWWPCQQTATKEDLL